MKTTYKEIFAEQVFSLFTDACGGDPAEFADLLYARYVVEPGLAFADDVVYFGVLNYFRRVVVPHKIAVWQAGQALLTKPEVAEWLGETAAATLDSNLWEHDMSKFSAAESIGYSQHNFADKSKDIRFERAWHHHKMHNPHHPEYWLNPNRAGILEPMDMPGEYVIEMIADWQGASATYGTDLPVWLRDNLQKFAFSSRTAARLSRALRFVGIETDSVAAEGFTGLTLIGYMFEEAEWMKMLLPNHYACTPRENGVYCCSQVGIDENDPQKWASIFNAVKQKFGERFMEIFHQTCTNHVEFTVFLRK